MLPKLAARVLAVAVLSLASVGTARENLVTSTGDSITYSVNWFGHPDGTRQYDMFSGPCAVFKISAYYYQPPRSYFATSYVPTGRILWVTTPHFGNSDGGGFLIGKPQESGLAKPKPGEAGLYTDIIWPDPKFLTVLGASCAPLSDAGKSVTYSA